MKNHKEFLKIYAAALLGVACLFASPTHAQSGQKPYTYVEQMPQFDGGETAMLQFLGANTRYPEDAKAAGTEGLVVLSFVVTESGALNDVKVLKSLSPSTDKEAARVVKLMDGKWQPGRQNGKVVPVRYTLPLRFAMTKEANVNTQPQYKGGQQALQTLFTRPAGMPTDAQVAVRFTVNPDGSVAKLEFADTRLVKTAEAGQQLNYMDPTTFNLQHKNQLAQLVETAAHAVRASSGNWLPATEQGKPVASQLTLTFPYQPQASAPNLDKPYTFEQTDVAPTLQLGPLEKFIAKNLRYPRQTTFSGDVDVAFTIDKAGKLLGPVISNPTTPEIQKEIERVFSLSEGNWKAGFLNGQPVTAVKKLRIRFVTKGTSATTPAGTADVVVTRYE